jgi:serine/threonine protein kinase
MAPEVEMIATTAEANVYSLGRIIYELYGEGSEDIPERVRTLLESCLNPNPEARVTAYDILRTIRKPQFLIHGPDLDSYLLYTHKLETFCPPQIPIDRISAAKPRRQFLSDFLVNAASFQYDPNPGLSPDEIGHVAFSTVFRPADSVIVCKEYDDRVTSEKQRAKDLIREAELLIHLRHPAIIRLVGHNIFHRRLNRCFPLIQTKFYSRGQLSDVINRPDFDPTARMKAVYGLVAAVFYMHELKPKVLHRDLKPENIFVDANYEIHIGDFNQGKVSDDWDIGASQTVGTPLYRAPELDGRSKMTYDPSVDVYSTGMTIYSIITGKPPFHELSEIERLLKLRAGNRPSFDPRIPELLWHVTEMCWANDPQSRAPIGEVERKLRHLRSGDLLEGADYDAYMAYVQLTDYARRKLKTKRVRHLYLAEHYKQRRKFTKGVEIARSDRNKISMVELRRSKKKFAAKELIRMDIQSQQSFLKELEVLARLIHPAFVQWFFWDFVGVPATANPVLFMEYMPKDLFHVVLDETRKMTTIFGIACAIEQLGNVQVCHFDLEPSSIMFRSELEVCIIDFNRAKEFGAPAVLDWDCDLRYKAPELFGRAEVKASAALDIYSFGMLMHLILTGRHPFGPEVSDVAAGQPPDIEDFGSDPLRQLILQCVSADPAARPPIDSVLEKIAENPLPNVDADAFRECMTKVRPVPRVVMPCPPKQPSSAHPRSPRSAIAMRKFGDACEKTGSTPSLVRTATASKPAGVLTTLGGRAVMRAQPVTESRLVRPIIRRGKA